MPSVLTTRRIFETWWPLALSWLFMAVELPTLSAVVARLADPAVQLAAYGGVVFPLSLLIESPIIMLLAASTALSHDRRGYDRLRHFMWRASAVLTLIHVVVAFSPVFDWIADGLLNMPREVLEPARVGLRIMTPWTGAIAYRRFNQGALIRFGQSRAVGTGTAVRLASHVSTLCLLFAAGAPGIVVATSAMTVGVLAEATYIGVRVRPLVRERMPDVSGAAPLHGRAFLAFYVPLALTPLLELLAEPIGAAAMARMPHALESLGAWPAVFGIVWVPMSVGIAFQEVVVALSAEPGAERSLRRFAIGLAVVTGAPLMIMAATPLADLWYRYVAGLPPQLAELARTALWIAPPLPVLVVGHSWLQGQLVHARRTHAIPEALALFLGVATALAVCGVYSARWPGLHVALAALVAGAAAQFGWLVWRSRDTAVPESTTGC
jgi:hypothetical protein